MYLNQYKQNKSDSISNNNGDNNNNNKNDDGKFIIIIIMVIIRLWRAAKVEMVEEVEQLMLLKSLIKESAIYSLWQSKSNSWPSYDRTAWNQQEKGQKTTIWGL